MTVLIFLKLCYSIEVRGSNEICQATLELKTDSNVELLQQHIRNKHFRMKSVSYSNFIRTIAVKDILKT